MDFLIDLAAGAFFLAAYVAILRLLWRAWDLADALERKLEARRRRFRRARHIDVTYVRPRGESREKRRTLR